jgi:hypothetical protein
MAEVSQRPEEQLGPAEDVAIAAITASEMAGWYLYTIRGTISQWR